jgi:hypothetical protein
MAVGKEGTTRGGALTSRECAHAAWASARTAARATSAAAVAAPTPEKEGVTVVGVESVVADTCRSAEWVGKDTSSAWRAASATGAGTSSDVKRMARRDAGPRTCSLSRGQGGGEGSGGEQAPTAGGVVSELTPVSRGARGVPPTLPLVPEGGAAATEDGSRECRAPAGRTVARRKAVTVVPQSTSCSTRPRTRSEQWSCRPTSATSGGGRGGSKAEEYTFPAVPSPTQMRASAGLGSSVSESAARSPSVAATDRGTTAAVVGSRCSWPRRRGPSPPEADAPGPPLPTPGVPVPAGGCGRGAIALAAAVARPLAAAGRTAAVSAAARPAPAARRITGAGQAAAAA